MVWSSACISVAPMVQTVMIARCGTGSKASLPGMVALARPLGSEQLGQCPAVAGVDLGFDTHAGAQRGIAVLVLDSDANRDALHHLHPVARGILRRQDREFRAAVGRDTLHGSLPGAAGIGVHRDRDLVAG